MGNILDTIADKTRERMQAEEAQLPTSRLRELAQEAAAKELAGEPSPQAAADASAAQAQGGSQAGTAAFAFPFESALGGEGFSFICEAKKASPSKGVIAEDFPYLEIAQDYERAGADAISCLTEPFWFLGKDEYLAQIADTVDIPVLRKDFVVCERMVYQAKVLGASAVLLIAAILDDAQLREYFAIAEALGLSCLFEAHDAQEIERCLSAGARIVGVNNRNLKDFNVDFSNSSKLRSLVPEGVVYVAESGVKNADDVAQMAAMGADAALIGEALMRSSDKAALLSSFKDAAQAAREAAAAETLGAARADGEEAR